MESPYAHDTDLLAKDHGERNFDFCQRKALSNAVPIQNRDKTREIMYLRKPTNSVLSLLKVKDIDGKRGQVQLF